MRIIATNFMIHGNFQMVMYNCDTQVLTLQSRYSKKVQIMGICKFFVLYRNTIRHAFQVLYTFDSSNNRIIHNYLNQYSKTIRIPRRLKRRKVGVKCFECGADVPHDEISIGDDGNKYCEDCFQEQFIICDECSNIENIDDSYYDEARGVMLCHECTERHYSYCEDCHELIHDNLLWRGRCEACAENYYICEECNALVYCDDVYSNDDGDIYCEECYNNRMSNDSSYANKIIHDYMFKPEPELHKLVFENTLYMGIELETEGDCSLAEEFLEYCESIHDESYLYLKHDGSIDGFEIVTHPLTLKYQHKHMQWHKILKWLKDCKFKSYTGGHCGLHVHVNRNHFKTSEINKLRYFVSHNFEQIKSFSKRGNNTSYCKAEKYTFQDLLYDNRINNTPTNDDRYIALNLQNSKTIEFRIFRGTLSMSRFMATLQFVDAISHYVKLMGYNFGWDEFISWCDGTNNYNHFVKYINK